jgi:hypothetical protein
VPKKGSNDRFSGSKNSAGKKLSISILHLSSYTFTLESKKKTANRTETLKVHFA